MAGIFKIQIRHDVYEEDSYKRSAFQNSDDFTNVLDVEKIYLECIDFINYIKENNEYIGVTLKCDGTIVNLKVNEEYSFTYDGTLIDDEGSPEDFFVNYSLKLVKYK